MSYQLKMAFDNKSDYEQCTPSSRPIEVKAEDLHDVVTFNIISRGNVETEEPAHVELKQPFPKRDSKTKARTVINVAPEVLAMAETDTGSMASLMKRLLDEFKLSVEKMAAN